LQELNSALIGNIACLTSVRDGLVLDSFNYIKDNTVFFNITSNFNNVGIRPINLTYNPEFVDLLEPVKLNINNATFAENNIGIEAF